MSQYELRKIMMDLPNNINKEQLEGMSGTIQVIFTGEGASNWAVSFKDQTCNVSEGIVENPDLTLRTDAEIGAKIFAGNLDPARAYMLGKLKVSGDLSLGMKITKLFSNLIP
jgi:putative sterol carrier protein